MIGPFNSWVIFDGDGRSTEHKVAEKWALSPDPSPPGDILRSFLRPAEDLSPTRRCAALPPSFHWERMFDTQAIPSSILDVSFHGFASHRSAPELLTLIPQLFVLAAPPVLLTWQKQAKAASLAHRGRSNICHPLASTAPPLRPRTRVVGLLSFIFLFL